MKRIAIVILNWNTRELLDKYLPFVINYSQEADVIVADNGSSDNSIEFVKECFPSVRIIDNGKNLGFTGGYNAALKEVEAEYYVLLNSDVEVTKDWIKPIIELMDNDKQVAVCQPKLLSYYQRDKFEYAGACGGFIDYLGYPFCRGRVFEAVEKDKGQYEDSVECFWASGAAMFVRSELWHRFGGLDEMFFAHQEEIDFCWRVKNAGYKVCCEPKSVVYHLGGGTLNKVNPYKTYLNFRNNLYLLYKNLPQRKMKKIMFIRFFMDMLAALVFLLKGSVGEFKAVFKAYKDYRINRCNLQRTTNDNDLTGIYPKSIVFADKLLGKKTFDRLYNR